MTGRFCGDGGFGIYSESKLTIYDVLLTTTSYQDTLVHTMNCLPIAVEIVLNKGPLSEKCAGIWVIVMLFYIGTM